MADRGAVTLVDIIIGVVVIVAVVALAPVWTYFIGLAASAADPFTQTVLQLFIPLLLLGVIVSLGVSARDGA
jgi:hypothetical protein